MSNKKHTRKRDPAQLRYSILDDEGVACTCADAANQLGIKGYMVRAYVVKHNAKTFNDVRAIRSKLEFNRLALASSRSDQLLFDRSLLCYRKDFSERCKYYMKMLDDVVFESHISVRCKNNEDSTVCPYYDGELLKIIKIDMSVINTSKSLLPSYV